MKINPSTKISHILRHNPDAIKAIAGINPHFRKLNNPLLRRVLAPRVTLADAARVGQCDIRQIFDVLEAIGFEPEITGPKEEKAAFSHAGETSKTGIPDKLVTLDVSSILESGKDPFRDIMDKLAELPPGFGLHLIAPFEPVPLIRILQGKGYESVVEKPSDGKVHVYFIQKKQAGKAPEESAGPLEKISPEDFALVLKSFKGEIREIDVRDLEMPEPMVRILQELEAMPFNGALFVHHKRVPQYLLPGLTERNYSGLYAEEKEGEVKLLIVKK